MRSCVSTRVCLRLRPTVAWVYFDDGNEGSMALILLYRLLFFHQALVSFFVSLLTCCLIADKLSGRFLRRKGGRRSSLLDPNPAAIFACSSATSFPFESMCPAIQVSVISIFGRFAVFCLILFAFSSSCILVMSCLILLIRYCADCGRLLSIVLIVAWLSMLRLMQSRVPIV